MASISSVPCHRNLYLTLSIGFYNDSYFFAEFGENFRLIKQCWRSEDDFLVEVNTTRTKFASHTYRFDPAVLDACIHVMVHPLITGNMDKNTYYLPSEFKRFFFYNIAEEETMPNTLYAHGSKARWSPGTVDFLTFISFLTKFCLSDAISYNIIVTDIHGRPFCQFHQFTVALHTYSPDLSTRYDLAAETLSSIDITTHAECQMLKVTDLVPRTFMDKSNLYFIYVLGEEKVLQSVIDGIDLRILETVWVLASPGVDGAAARGFSRSLRREFHTLCIRLVICKQPWCETVVKSLTASLATLSLLDEEVEIDMDGQVKAYRLQPTPMASTASAFDSSLPWDLRRSKDGEKYTVCQATTPPPRHGHVLVEVDFVEKDAWRSNIWGFSGVSSSGEAIVGISSQSVSNKISIEQCFVIPWGKEKHLKSSQAAGLVTTIVVAHLASCSLGCRRVNALITHSETRIGQLLAALLRFRGFMVNTLNAKTALSEILSLEDKYTIVVSGHTDPKIKSILTAICSGPNRPVFWNDVDTILYHNQASISSNILTGFSDIPPAFHSIGVSAPIGQFVEHTIGSLIPQKQALFQSSKGYVLVGGIGSLGLRMAVWMYNVCFKYLFRVSPC